MPANFDEIMLRPERPADALFLFELYASTRQQELEATGWPVALQEAFLRTQFNAQSLGYKNTFPNAEFAIISLGPQAVGRIVINRAENEIRLVDIALLPVHRGRGMGTELMRQLLREAAAAKKPVRLSVLKGQRAFRLYQRLGFQKSGEADLRDQMEWLPQNNP